MDSTPSIPAPPSSRQWTNITRIIFIVVVLLSVLAYFGQKMKMGKRYKFSDKKSVSYSGKATEDDAKKLGEILRTEGCFNGKKEMDVLIKKMIRKAQLFRLFLAMDGTRRK
jgi:hypothetical protein